MAKKKDPALMNENEFDDDFSSGLDGMDEEFDDFDFGGDDDLDSEKVRQPAGPGHRRENLSGALPRLIPKSGKRRSGLL